MITNPNDITDLTERGIRCYAEHFRGECKILVVRRFTGNRIEVVVHRPSKAINYADAIDDAINEGRKLLE